MLSTGACTAVGLTAATSAAAVRAGIARFAEHPSITDWLSQPAIVARPPAEPPEAPPPSASPDWRSKRSADALARGRQRPRPMARSRSSSPCPSRAPASTRACPKPWPRGWRIGFRGNVTVSVVPQGHAAGGLALQQAAHRLAASQWRWAAIVGVDSYISAETIAWLDASASCTPPTTPGASSPARRRVPA